MSDGFLQPVRLTPVKLTPVEMIPVTLENFNDWIQERAGGVYYKGRFFPANVIAMVGRIILTEPTDTNVIPYSTDVSQWAGSGGATESGGVWTIPVGGEVRMGTGLTITAELWTAWIDIAAISGALLLRVNDGTSSTDVALTATGINENQAVLAAGTGYVAIRNDGTGTQTVSVEHSQFEKGTRSSRIITNGAPASRAATNETSRLLTDKEYNVLAGEPDGVELVTGGSFDNPGDWSTEASWSVSGGVATAVPEVGSLFKRLSQPLPTIIGAKYLITGRCISLTGGVIYLRKPRDVSVTDTTLGITSTGEFSFMVTVGSDNDEFAFSKLSDSSGIVIDNVSVQKVNPDRGQVSFPWKPGASWDDVLNSGEQVNLVSVGDAIFEIKNNTSGGQILSENGAFVDYDWQANTAVTISARYGNQDDMLSPSGDPISLPAGQYEQVGADGVWGTPIIHSGHVVIDPEKSIKVPDGVPPFSMEFAPPVIEALP